MNPVAHALGSLIGAGLGIVLVTQPLEAVDYLIDERKRWREVHWPPYRRAPLLVRALRSLTAKGRARQREIDEWRLSSNTWWPR